MKAMKTNYCHEINKKSQRIHKTVEFMTCMAMLHDAMKVMNWTILKPLNGQTSVAFIK